MSLRLVINNPLHWCDLTQGNFYFCVRIHQCSREGSKLPARRWRFPGRKSVFMNRAGSFAAFPAGERDPSRLPDLFGTGTNFPLLIFGVFMLLFVQFHKFVLHYLSFSKYGGFPVNYGQISIREGRGEQWVLSFLRCSVSCLFFGFWRGQKLLHHLLFS